MMRVLVIDDDAMQHNFVALLFKHIAQPTPMTAISALEGLSIVKNTPVDLILLDVMMPIHDGFWALRKLRDNGFTGEIVMFSAFDSPDFERRARLEGADDYMRKADLNVQKTRQMLGIDTEVKAK